MRANIRAECLAQSQIIVADGFQRAIPHFGDIAHPLFRTLNDNLCHPLNERVMSAAYFQFAQSIVKRGHHDVDDRRVERSPL